jgi:hypothetical protein
MRETCYIEVELKTYIKISRMGAVKGAVQENFGAVKGPEGAVISAISSH